MVKTPHTIVAPQRESVYRSWDNVYERWIRRVRDNGASLRVRLIRKLAERVNGVDLSKVHVGDSLDLPSWDARILIAEGWAELVELPPEDIVAQQILDRESK